MKVKKIQSAFTLAELLVSIVIIGILASIVLASYVGITERANNASLAYDLKNASTKLKAYNAVYGSYPASLGANGCPVASGSLPADNNYCVKTTASNSVYNYTSSVQTFSLILKSPTNLYYQSTESVAQTTFTPAPFMQTITNANCPSTRTRAQDARDNKTYWVKKLGTGRCWMLTNLAYAGGGTNTYNDVKSLTLSTPPTSGKFSPGYYYINSNVTSFTTEPNNPTSNTDGTGQYGYYYNFCAMMGVQLSTTSCAVHNTTTLPTHNENLSICPNGWRVPTYTEIYNEFSMTSPSYGNNVNGINSASDFTSFALSVSTGTLYAPDSRLGWTGSSGFSSPDSSFIPYGSLYSMGGFPGYFTGAFLGGTAYAGWATQNTEGAMTMRCIAN